MATPACSNAARGITIAVASYILQQGWWDKFGLSLQSPWESAGRPLWRAKLRGGNYHTLQSFAQFKLLATLEPDVGNNSQYRIHKTSQLWFVDWVSFYPQWYRLIPVLLQITWPQLLLLTNEESWCWYRILGNLFWLLVPWNNGTSEDLVLYCKSIRTALIRGIVNKGTLGEIFFYDSKNGFNGGWSWLEKSSRFFNKLALVESDNKNKNIKKETIDIRKEIGGMIPKDSKLTVNFNHYIQWFGKFQPMFASETTCCLHLVTKPRWRRTFDSIFNRWWQEIIFRDILVLVKNCLNSYDANNVSKKLFASK